MRKALVDFIVKDYRLRHTTLVPTASDATQRPPRSLLLPRNQESYRHSLQMKASEVCYAPFRHPIVPWTTCGTKTSGAIHQAGMSHKDHELIHLYPNT